MFKMIESRCTAISPTGVVKQKNDYDCDVCCLQRMHQLVIYNSVSESVLEMGFRSICYN